MKDYLISLGVRELVRALARVRLGSKESGIHPLSTSANKARTSSRTPK